jgi:hypothetical protein
MDFIGLSLRGLRIGVEHDAADRGSGSPAGVFTLSVAVPTARIRAAQLAQRSLTVLGAAARISSPNRTDGGWMDLDYGIPCDVTEAAEP